MSYEASKRTLNIMKMFAESLGFEFPKQHQMWRNLHAPWNFIRTVDRQTGNCYLNWCERHGKTFNKIGNLEAYLRSTEESETNFEIGDWVLWLPWYKHAHRYGKVIDLKPCNHSREPYPVVRWLDGTESFTSCDFSRVVPPPIVEPSAGLKGIQLSLLSGNEVLMGVKAL